jgi:hypothetical protein
MSDDESLWLKLATGTELSDEELKTLHLHRFEPHPNLIMTFERFLKYDDEGYYNLYIVWRGKQALYVGISKQNISMRWFYRGGQSHMRYVQRYSGTLEGGSWVGLSTIGQVIQNNFPKSLKWKIELREYSTFSWDRNEKLDAAEQRLIHELRPLFNATYRQDLSEKEQRLLYKLLYPPGH